MGAFTYTGTFEIHAAHYGAKSVLGIDISEQAVMQANKNAALNGLEKIFESVVSITQRLHIFRLFIDKFLRKTYYPAHRMHLVIVN